MEDLLQYFEMLLEYAENNAQNLNRTSQQALAQLIAQFEELIEELGSTTGGGIPNPPPEAPPPGMQSSNVAGTSYDDKTGNLQVQFLGKHPNREGPRYVYPGTPPQIAELVQSGAIPARSKGSNKWGSWFPGKRPSAGASVFTLLKETGVPYQRIS